MSVLPSLLGRRARLIRACVLLAATAGILLHLSLFSRSFPVTRATERAWLDSLVQTPNDSWFPMSRAFAYTAADPRLPLYSQIFFDQQIKFQYPPSSLLIFSALTLPPVQSLMRLTGATPFAVLNAVSYVLFLVTSVFVAKIFLASIERTATPPPWPVRDRDGFSVSASSSC